MERSEQEEAKRVWLYGKPFDHEWAKEYLCCRKLQPEEVVLASDGYDLGFYDGPDPSTLICVPVNWVGVLAGNCDFPVYRKVKNG